MSNKTEMAKVKVLIEGYAKTTKNGWVASSTCVLIQENKINVIVDPGINRELLLKNLKAEGLTPEDIDFIFLTHDHLDHTFLASIFTSAQIVGDGVIYKGDRAKYCGKFIPGTSIEILDTPGHGEGHSSLLVKAKEGIVIIAGDVFWWRDQERQITDNKEKLLTKKDLYTSDRDALIKSRKKILEIADWIIPGHGKMFRNPRKKHEASGKIED